MTDAQRLDRTLIRAVAATLFALGLLTAACLHFQWQEYGSAITHALAQAVPDNSAALSFGRALDAAVVKTSSLALGFSVVFLGALYVLRTATAAYKMNVADGAVKGALETSSPGLVMVTLGLVIVAVVVLTKSDVNYTAPTTYIAAPSDDSIGKQSDVATPTLPMGHNNGGSQ